MMLNYTKVDLSDEQIDIILKGLIGGEHEGLITKEQAIEIYYALDRGDEHPWPDVEDSCCSR